MDSSEKIKNANGALGLNEKGEKADQKTEKAEEGKDKQQPADVKPAAKLEMYPYRLYNKIEDNYHLANKKALWINMRHYYEAIGEDPFNALPVTFHIKEGLEDAEFFRF